MLLLLIIINNVRLYIGSVVMLTRKLQPQLRVENGEPLHSYSFHFYKITFVEKKKSTTFSRHVNGPPSLNFDSVGTCNKSEKGNGLHGVEIKSIKFPRYWLKVHEKHTLDRVCSFCVAGGNDVISCPSPPFSLPFFHQAENKREVDACLLQGWLRKPAHPSCVSCLALHLALQAPHSLLTHNNGALKLVTVNGVFQ